MHEVSLVAALLEECERRAEGRPVKTVRVRHASTIPEPTLRQAWEMLADGRALSHATLEVETFSFALDCACGFHGPLGHDDVISGWIVACPECGNASQRARTAELELLELRTDD